MTKKNKTQFILKKNKYKNEGISQVRICVYIHIHTYTHIFKRIKNWIPTVTCRILLDQKCLWLN